jgi:hypothetical protein
MANATLRYQEFRRKKEGVQEEGRRRKEEGRRSSGGRKKEEGRRIFSLTTDN